MDKEELLKGLRHPLVLLIVGAMISSYIIPYYTKAWQDHQKELELKTNLVSEVSDAVATLLIKTQTTKAIMNTPYKEFYDAYQQWESANSIIGSKLEAYFSGSRLPTLWSNYSAVLGDFARLSISTDMCSRAGYVEVIQKYFSTNPDRMDYVEIDNCTDKPYSLDRVYSSPFTSDVVNIDWDELIKQGNQSRLSNSWLELKQNMINQKDKLIQEILQSHIQTFS
jgi:hypothetical protein